MDNEQPRFAPAKQNRFKRIFHHPNFNVVCGIVTILSLVFGIWCWHDGIKKRTLTYYISNSRTPIVQKGTFDDFTVNFQGKPIQGNLTATEVQIWNDGKEPIRKEDVLENVTIRTLNHAQIYRVNLAQTRNVVNPSIRLGQKENIGAILLDWNILEKGDGIKVQFVYGSDIAEPITVDGIIVGQNKPNAYSTYGNAAHQIYAITVIILYAAIIPISGWLMGSFFFRYKWNKFILVISILLILGLLVILHTKFQDRFYQKTIAIAPPPFGW